MRKFIKYSVRGILLLAVILAAVAFWKREQLTRLMAVNSLFSQEKIVNNFSNMDTLFLTRPLDRGDGEVSTLPTGNAATLPDATDDWIKTRSVTSLLVMKDGMIVAEDYFLDTTPDDRRISWSVAKSFLSALFGIVMAEGQIASLDDPVTKYAPTLAGSAYDGATIRNVLNMSSGVRFNEDYLDFNSDINRMGRVIALGGTMDGFTTGQSETQYTPGDKWQYVSIDTHVIGMVIRGATGRSIPELLEEKIIAPLGFKAAPYYITDGEGVAFVLGGLNVTTRDYARFGQMFLNGGRWNGAQIVPEDWVNASTRASAPTAADRISYGFQWWVPKGAIEGEYLARGIYGQYIYVNQPLGVVIATTATDKKFREAGISDQNIAMFRLIAQSL
ncbi:serine hydrolase domain-containing protein [Profundibacter sp.]